MVGEHAARAFAAELDTEGFPACPLCLWELAWAIFRGDAVRRTLVARTAEWIWPDIDDALRTAVVNARMREVAGAEHALRELDEKGWQSVFAFVIVERLAQRLAEEFASNRLL